MLGDSMNFYTVFFERDGEVLSTFSLLAPAEEGAREGALAWFREHPEHDPFAGNYEGLVMRIEKARYARGS